MESHVLQPSGIRCEEKTMKIRKSESAAGKTSAGTRKSMKPGIMKFVIVAAFACLTVAVGSAVAWAQTPTCTAPPAYTPDFSLNQSCMALNSDATFVLSNGSNLLQLTSSTGNQVGSAWYGTPQTVENGFTTSFQFQFTNPSVPPADGIAFVIQNSSMGAIGFTGGNGGAIAYGDDDSNANPSQGEGIPNSLAIEFDTFQNTWDPVSNGNGSDSHVAVQSCGLGPNTSHHGYLCGGTIGPNSTIGPPVVTSTNMADGAVHSVTIHYYAACPSPTCSPATPANIHVVLDGLDLYPSGVNVDLSSIGLAGGTNAYVGFTGATGGNWETQNILNWTFAPQLQGTVINTNNPSSLIQPFVFNSTAGQQVEMDVNYTTAFDTNGLLPVVSNTVPTVSNQGITHSAYAQMVAGTSLAMTDCFTANGEGTDANGNPLCSQMTITCTNANSSAPAGDNCPQSSQRSLYWTQILDSPGTGLSIPAGSAPALPEGSDNWSALHGSCVFEGPETGNLCPQSTLTQFELLSTDIVPKHGGTGTTTNSSFIASCCQLEWHTVPTVSAWSNSTTVPVSFTTYPPNPANPTNNWVASPNKSITWGEENLGATPDTTFPVPGDQTVINPNPTGVTGATACPSAWPMPGTVPPSFTAGGNVSVTGEGKYEVHFFSTACDNQEELLFPTSITMASASNVATFETAPFSVDLTSPTVTSITLNPPGGYIAQNASLAATVTCTDPSSSTVLGLFSGIAQCGSQSSPQGFTGQQTVTTTAIPLSTSTLGTNTFTAIAKDVAGNSSTASVTYQVVGADSLAIGMLGNLLVETGKNVTYTIFVVNSGPNAADLVTVADALPAGTTFVSSGYAIDSCTFTSGQPPQCSISAPTNSCGSVAGVCSIGTVPAFSKSTPIGAVVQITAKVTAKANTTITNTAAVSGANSNTDTKYTSAKWSTAVTK
jgi:uncharacterized repeat protein (TIGR01451 family)